MKTKVLFTSLLLLITLVGFAQKQKIKCTNLLIIPPDETWTQPSRFIGLGNEDDIRMSVLDSEKGAYTSLQHLKKDYSDLYKYITAVQVPLAGGGKGYIFKGSTNDDEIIIEMFAEFARKAYTINSRYPKSYDKEVYNKIIKSMSSLEADDKVVPDLTERLEYFIDWKNQGFKVNYVSYPAYPYNKAASASMVINRRSEFKIEGLDLSESDIDVDIDEIVLLDLDPEMDSLSQLKNKKAFAEKMLTLKEEYLHEKKKLVQSEEIKYDGGDSYRTVMEVTTDRWKAYFIYQYFLINGRVFEMKSRASISDVNLKRFEKLAATFKLL